MASPAVVMPLSAKEYRKRKARESVGKGKDTEPPMSSNHVTFIDNNASSATSNTPNGVPVVTVSPPPSENVDLPPASSDDAPSTQQQPNSPPPKQHPHGSLSAPSQPGPSSPNYPRSRSRPNTPPRSSPLATQPPISPKSSTGTFYSLAPASDDETTPQSSGKDDPNATNDLPPARPRPRPRRRKSYPDRLSSGARLSFIEAMNRLSQGSVLSQADDKNDN
ncbi:hypothetical protein JVU11DRAFT_6046 [Chiua virens]|nr:hypothetical protein JVU11DRAFT_6046 [Chiua virens]